MIHHLLTPLELAGLSTESKQRIEEALVEAFTQGAAHGCHYGRPPRGAMTALEGSDAEQTARTMMGDGHLGIRASRWFSKIPKSVDFGMCE